MKSTLVAQLVTDHIKTHPGMRKAELCEAVRVTTDQFQAAMPYIKRDCVRIRVKWYVKEEPTSE